MMVTLDCMLSLRRFWLWFPAFLLGHSHLPIHYCSSRRSWLRSSEKGRNDLSHKKGKFSERRQFCVFTSFRLKQVDTPLPFPTPNLIFLLSSISVTCFGFWNIFLIPHLLIFCIDPYNYVRISQLTASTLWNLFSPAIMPWTQISVSVLWSSLFPGFLSSIFLLLYVFHHHKHLKVLLS